IGRAGAHWATILAVAVSFAASCVVFADVLNGNSFNGNLYTWVTMGGDPGSTALSIGFQIDRLSALMMVVVTFVSLMVHVYTIGYMAEDPGYQRFFAYISLFTFSMLMLVMANNFLQLFFGWEAVGVVSYLLLGIGLVFAYFGTLDYQEVFAKAPSFSSEMTLICVLLFIGAMGKSAQFP